MQPDPIRPASSVEVPTYIPDDILDAYAEEARLHVEDTWSDRLVPTAVTVTPVPAAARGPLAGWSAKDRAFALLAGKMAFVGWTLLVALWSWLAWTTGSGTWTAFAAVGLITLGPGIAALVHLSGTRLAWSPRSRDDEPGSDSDH